MSTTRQQIGSVLLLVAGLLIAGLCYYKTTRTYQSVDIEQLRPTEKRQAPLFELYDQHKPSDRVRLASYLGRHRIILIFFDGNAGLFEDELLKPFRERHAQLKASDTIVIGISDALPQTVRKQIEEHRQQLQTADNSDDSGLPFAVLSDPDYHVHRLYQQYDEQLQQPRVGIFVIDRAGQLAWSQSGPKSHPAHPKAIARLIADR